MNKVKLISDMNSKPVHYIIWSVGPGGIELGVIHYVEQYYKNRPLFVYSIRAIERQLYDTSKVTVQQGCDGKWKPYWLYYRYCRKHKDDIFHLMNSGPILWALTMIAGVKNILYHIQGTTYFNNFFSKLYLKPAWLATRIFSGKAKVQFIANSKHSADVFHKEVLNLEPLLVYNGLDVERFWLKHTLRTKLHRIGYAGRLVPGKNVDLLIRLFEELAPRYPDVELHIAGEGPLEKQIVGLAQKSPYRDRIVLHGFIPDIQDFYQSVDLFLFTSAHESFGNVVAEALLTGLPIATTDLPAFNEIHGGENDFVLGHADDYPELKNNLIKTVENFSTLAQKAFKIGNRVREEFTVERHLTKIENIYQTY